MALTDYEYDYMLDSGPTENRLETIRESLPEILVSGSTIIRKGVPQFKQKRENPQVPKRLDSIESVELDQVD